MINKRYKHINIASIQECLITIFGGVSLFLLLILGMTVVITSVLLLIGVSISKYNIIISVLVAIVTFFLLKRNSTRLKLIFTIYIISFFLFVFSIMLMGKVVDLSWDGNTYHKDAVGALKNGWNPIHENYISFYEHTKSRDMNYIGHKVQNTHGFWQTYYAKGIWYFSADIYAFTGNIESGKCYTLLVMLIVFGITATCLYIRKASFSFSVLCGCLVTVTPVTIVQVFTYYNDGVLALLLSGTVISFLMLMDDKTDIIKLKEKYSILGFQLLLLIQTKFTGLAYGGLFCLVLYIFFILKKIRENKCKDIWKPTIVLSLFCLVSVSIVGFDPYIKNTLEKQNPFYPLIGENKVDIVTYNEPIIFHESSTPAKLVMSLFSETENINEKSGKRPNWKIPFTVHPKELVCLSGVDIRIGGYGVLFSGILCLSLIIIFFSLKTQFSRNPFVFALCLGLLVLIGLLSCFISESWWARYSPYLYFIPLIALVLLYFTYKSRWPQLVLDVFMMLMILNLSFYIPNYYENQCKLSQSETEKLASLSGLTIQICDVQNEFLGYLYLLDDYGVHYEIVNQLESKDTLCNGRLKYKKIEGGNYEIYQINAY